jgi:hypothetical protein
MDLIMKNIHILSIEKPRTYKGGKVSTFMTVASMMPTEFVPSMYITNYELIKEGDWCLFGIDALKPVKIVGVKHKQIYLADCKKIILTTDQDLIKDGVQAIDDDFLNWFVNNPSCESVEIVSELNLNGKNGLDRARFIYKIIIPKEEPKQETTLEEFIKKAYLSRLEDCLQVDFEDGVKLGVKWQSERSYSEEDFKLFARQYFREIKMDKSNLLWEDLADKCLEQFKKK